jgi:dihydrofolate reductase
MKAILAVNNLGFIGLGDQLLWHNTEDLKHFKVMTKGARCLVGWRTNEGLPPLPNRELVVDLRGEEVDPSTIDWCIGGKRTYEKWAPYFTELHISHIDNDLIGDVTLPDLKDLNPNCKIFNYYF